MSSTAPSTAMLDPQESSGAERHRLLLDIDDRPGLVADVATFLARRGANILELDSHAVEQDGSTTTFYMRVEFAAAGKIDGDEFAAAFPECVGADASLCWELWPFARRKRVCLLVSRYDHCLLDLLTRWRAGELPCEVGLVVSNHPDLADEVARFGVEYRHIPVTKATKPAAEQQLLDTVSGEFDLLVLARYMQILSGDFLARVGAPTINIHHSFLPAFAGADPYARARSRGVKIIGATAHYVTEDLDAGPIIDQDVARVTHRDTVEAMTQAGRDIERTVLARAVRWHLEDRIAVNGNSTVVFA